MVVLKVTGYAEVSDSVKNDHTLIEGVQVILCVINVV